MCPQQHHPAAARFPALVPGGSSQPCVSSARRQHRGTARPEPETFLLLCQGEGRVVYIRNLSSSMSSSELKKRFEVFGEIVECQVLSRTNRWVASKPRSGAPVATGNPSPAEASALPGGAGSALHPAVRVRVMQLCRWGEVLLRYANPLAQPSPRSQRFGQGDAVCPQVLGHGRAGGMEGQWDGELVRRTDAGWRDGAAVLGRAMLGCGAHRILNCFSGCAGEINTASSPTGIQSMPPYL